jgi:hypothetical protein
MIAKIGNANFELMTRKQVENVVKEEIAKLKDYINFVLDSIEKRMQRIEESINIISQDTKTKFK